MKSREQAPRNQTVVLLILASALLLAPALVAQEQAKPRAKTASMEGVLIFYDGLPMGGVKVIAKLEEGEFEAQAVTAKDGSFRIDGLETPGGARYTILVQIGGQQVFELKKVPVRPGQTVKMDIDLKAEARKQGVKVTEEDAQKMRSQVVQKKKGDSLKVRFDSGVKFLNAGQFKEAAAEFEAAAAIDDTQYAVFANLARAHDGAGNVDGGIAAYQNALALKPDEGGLHNNLGQLLLKAGRTDEALASFEKAAEASPEKAGMFFYNIGVTLYNQNKLKEAIGPFRRTTEVEPQRAEAYYFLGVCLFSQAEWKMEGTTAKVIPLPGTAEAFETYLKLDAQGRFAQQAKETLATIQPVGGSPQQ